MKEREREKNTAHKLITHNTHTNTYTFAHAYNQNHNHINELDFEKKNYGKTVVQLILLNMQEKLFKCDQNHCVRLKQNKMRRRKKLIEMNHAGILNEKKRWKNEATVQ